MIKTNATYFVLGLTMVCCAVISLFLYSHQKTNRMRAALDSALVQNRNYVPFTSDSTMKEVTAYFDHPLHFWTTANDRLRAHYALGCVYRDLHDAPIALLSWEDAIAAADTTAADCDFATLFRVYGQMASIYFRQLMPEKELEARNKLCHYALLAGDTLNYIRGLLMRDDAFLALGDTAAIYHNVENVRRLYLQRGLKAEAAQVYPMAIRLALEKQQLDSARAMMQVFEQESGLFDEQGNIAPTREIYYYHKGMYFLGINRLDSAELWFRKTMTFPEVNLNAYHGLMSLYKVRNNIDSTFKYTTLYDKALIVYLDQSKTAAIVQSGKMYDYTHQQQIAKKEKEKILLLELIIAIGTLIGTVVISALYLYYTKEKHDKEEKEEKLLHLTESYSQAIDSLAAAKKEACTLKEALSEEEKIKNQTMSSLREMGKDKDEQISYWENLVFILKKQIAWMQESESRMEVNESEILALFKEKAKAHIKEVNGRKVNVPASAATKRDWQELFRMTQFCHPKFYLFLEGQKFSDLKKKVCLLSRYGFKNPEIAILTKAHVKSISNARMLMANLFGLESTALLDDYLRGI